MTSGGKEYRLLAVSDTFICKSCKEVVDVCIGGYGPACYRQGSLIKENNPDTDLNFNKCPKCGSDKNLVKWNKGKRPCPKCEEKMEKDASSEIIMLWD